MTGMLQIRTDSAVYGESLHHLSVTCIISPHLYEHQLKEKDCYVVKMLINGHKGKATAADLGL